MIDYLVSYADTDAGGVLHHARYIELAEHGYHAWLKHRSLSFRKLSQEHDLSMVVYDLAAKYKSAIFLEDEIQIATQLHAIDRKGLEWNTRILKNEVIAFSVRTKMACIAVATRSIVSVPDFLLKRLEHEVGIVMFVGAE
ncbi:MAG: acyl-CoA thioesterase [Rhodanobacter sp.]|jgi:acyl-CoA thioester hydrolase|nr:acyl-CoA thioesterase [Rhodanobacter sp.]